MIRNADTASKVNGMFKEHKILKQYLAITKNAPENNDGIIDIPLIRREVNGVYKVSLIN